MTAESFHERRDCRLCKGEQLRRVLTLEPTPLANEFLQPGDRSEELFPLYLVECLSCGHVQLPVVVDPARLFRNYVYVSGTSAQFRGHLESAARALVATHGLAPGDGVVEIGSNDGTMLREFQRLGCHVLGVDPAEKIANAARAAGVPTIADFFTPELAEQILVMSTARPKLVVANNVFAHADDLLGIVRGVKTLLPDGGAFVFEVQYVVDMVQRGLFDMVYHEHLSYHSVGSLQKFFRRLDMTLVSVEQVDTHGGSIRCTVLNADGPPTASVRAMIELERAALTTQAWEAMSVRVERAGIQLRRHVARIKHDGRTIAGYGAPAKATTLMREFRLGSELISYVVDDSSWKQSLCMPGTQIPVQQLERVSGLMPDGSCKTVYRFPDVFVIFAWNFADSILDKLRRIGFFDGRRSAIVPLPEFREVWS